VDKRSLVLYLSGLAAAGAVVGLAASCSDQPRIKCTAGHGAFAVIYTSVGGAADCAPAPGELLGVEAYNYPLGDGTNLDPNRGSLGMEPLDLAHEFDIRPNDKRDQNPAHKKHSLGDWLTPEPGGDNFCVVNNPNPIEQDLGYIAAGPDLPDGGAGTPAVKSISVKYEWTNVRFYNTPASPGTQLIADLTYTATKGLPDGGTMPPCTGQYKAVGLWPAIPCEDENHMIDETLCFAEPAKGRASGSGISPDLLTRCDPDLRHCVLAKDPPAFK
jgi:hypothetical protein